MDWRTRLLSYLKAQLSSADSLEFGRLAAMPAGASNDTAALEYYEALGLYRMAIVMSGWAGRAGVGSCFGMDAIVRRLSVLLGPRWAA